ncbi:sensor histidine kinase [Thermocatellispora tengchongensis]|uniref:sensor histidine kinase n=1 Tax=Thermocatellispora tengchongensis TaxID=1073253 RepID=UPI003626734C
MLVPPLVAVCAAVAVRRRAPLVALGLGLVGISGDLVVGPSLGTVLVFTDNLYAATLYGPRAIVRWMLRITAVLAVVVGAGAWVVAGDWRVLAVAAVQAGLVLTTPVLTAVIIRQHREQAEAERTRAEQVARLAELDRRAAVNEERTRMARELHDLIANHFSAIAIQATGVLSRSDLDAATVRKVLESIRENGVQGMAEMRSMIQLLRQEGTTTLPPMSYGAASPMSVNWWSGPGWPGSRCAWRSPAHPATCPRPWTSPAIGSCRRH